MDEEVVVVTFNYRLNIFGFLSTGDEIIPGNLGLKDQVMALQWVNQNIRKFSGDPNLVTIFGAGDGATSVGLLMLSPLSKGLFRKAITQSGSSLKLSTIQKNPKQAAQRIARVINCGKILECLRLVDDPKKLAEIQKDSFGLFSNPLAFFGPVIETPSKDAFLTEHPYSIISSGRQARVPCTEKSKEPTPALKKVSNWFKKTILRKTTPAPKHLGVCNGDGLPLLFKYPDLKIKKGSEDYAFSKSLGKPWVQFSKDETKMVFNDKAWLPVSPDDPKWMKFDKIEQDSGFKTISQTFINRKKLWSSLKYLAPFDQ